MKEAFNTCATSLCNSYVVMLWWRHQTVWRLQLTHPLILQNILLHMYSWELLWFTFTYFICLFPTSSRFNLCPISHESVTCRASKCHNLRKLWRHYFLSFSYFSFKISTILFQSLFYQNINFGTYILKTNQVITSSLYLFLSEIARQVTNSSEMGHICKWMRAKFLWQRCRFFFIVLI